MRVREIMTSPVITVSPEQGRKHVAQLLLRLKIGAVPVVDSRRHLIGIVSESDLVGLEATPDPRLHLRRDPARETWRGPRTVRELMTRKVVTLREDADVAEAAQLMMLHGYRSIPVVADHRVVGIVARRDLLGVIARRDAEVRTEVEGLLESQAGIVEHYDVQVSDGVATLTGPPDPRSRSLPALLARTVPGVFEVRFAEAAAGPDRSPAPAGEGPASTA